MRNELSLDWIRRATLKLHRAVSIRDSVRMLPLRDFIFVGSELLRFVGHTAGAEGFDRRLGGEFPVGRKVLPTGGLGDGDRPGP
jgi:hypothetical protein